MGTRALTRITDCVYAYAGTTDASPLTNSFGANAGFVVGRDGVAVIDTLMSAKEARLLLADIRRTTDKPIRYVINTHHHMDHTWGNCVFADLGAEIIAHVNTREALTQPANGLARAERYRIRAADLEGTRIALPTITFRRDLRLELGDVSIDLTFPGPTHTPGAITAWVPQEQFLFTGDILFTHYHVTMIDGDVPCWIRVLEDLQKLPAKAIVPGHGPISSAADLQAMADYLRVFDTEARALCTGRPARDSAEIAAELARRLPDQGRTELEMIIRANLLYRYLPAMQ